MNVRLLRFVVFTVGLTVLGSAITEAQKLTVEAYQIRVVTRDGKRFYGVLNDVTDTCIHIGPSYRNEQILLTDIRKVVIHRNNKKNAVLTGAILGGLAFGFLSHESFQRNPPEGSIAYGLTLTFAAAGGAAAGSLLGSTFANLTSRVIRPLRGTDPKRSLQGQLEPFSLQYQHKFIDRRPANAH